MEKLLIVLISATFSGLLGWSIAIKRHRYTQLWNKKLEVYTSALACLHELKKLCELVLDDFIINSKDDVDNAVREFRIKKHDLHKYRDLGYLLISEEAEEHLVMLLVNLEISSEEHQIVTDDLETSIERYEADANLIYIEKCISLFKEEAKNDLKI